MSEEDSGGEEPYRFSNLREDAWDRWLVDSEPLAAAHTSTFSATERECGRTIAALLRLVRWIVVVLKGPEAAAPSDSPANTNPVDMRHVPANRPSPHPRSEAPYVLQWERHFDQLHPAVGGTSL
ncbi:hypothetical protein L0U85_02055 [Glycomyces sp. L485]|uniref:hypothetical protein n=1 Tax=Glycomyces sp. L485 TaxID=2909235 RepID=UPI001F4B1FDA|nr:hypothetical protein [Glycomyces sp. L485]MCH7229650.1 hypothetical protein [Glycomyces sp. L485]